MVFAFAVASSAAVAFARCVTGWPGLASVVVFAVLAAFVVALSAAVAVAFAVLAAFVAALSVAVAFAGYASQ